MIKKCKLITKWLDRMYLFKEDTLRDGVIDAKEIKQWKQILNKYEESLKEITFPTNEEKIDLKKYTRTDQSITTTEEVININPSAYHCNKQKNHCMLFIWKHETGIKINFDLWKP